MRKIYSGADLVRIDVLIKYSNNKEDVTGRFNVRPYSTFKSIKDKLMEIYYSDFIGAVSLEIKKGKTTKIFNL